MLKLIVKLLQPYIPRATSLILNQLLRDNDRLNQQWKQKYSELEREMWYYKDKYQDAMLSGRDEDS
jgi:hypothetical protein